MTVTAGYLESLIETELRTLADPRPEPLIRTQLVSPRLMSVAWEYGPPAAHPCWRVLLDEEMGLALLYSEQGFGPATPWGIVGIGPDLKPVSMGMDSGWFRSFLDAWFDSLSATRLPIWRVFRSDPNGQMAPVTDEMGWDEAWALTERWRAEDPHLNFDVEHTIAYGAGSP